MPLLQGVQRKEKTVPEEIPGADRGARSLNRTNKSRACNLQIFNRKILTPGCCPVHDVIQCYIDP